MRRNERDYQVFTLEHSSATVVADYEISLNGKKLLVIINAPNDMGFTLKFNDVNSPKVPIRHKSVFLINFDRLFFSGNFQGQIIFIGFPDPGNNIFYPDPESGNDSAPVAAGNNYYLVKRAIGIMVKTFGNLVVNFTNSGVGNRTYSNVPPYTFMPISPTNIINTTTSDIEIIYDDTYLS